ncbi:MAG: divergent polysaccharide deacetylase family protein [Spirochaetaceae bacterium]|nr:divergent polysaccharide deacetylase family protein [Spirochaetaceae bacterium]
MSPRKSSRRAGARGPSPRERRLFLLTSLAFVGLALAASLYLGGRAAVNPPVGKAAASGPREPSPPSAAAGNPEAAAGSLGTSASNEGDRDLAGLRSTAERFSGARQVPPEKTNEPRSLPASFRPPRETRPARKGSLIFVIDDVGYNLAELEPFLALPFPITFAVLPGLAHSREAAERIRAAGKELILHQPMEAQGGQNPGPEAIFLADSPEAAAARLSANLDSLPGARGFNNHMGSAVTRDEVLMTALLTVAKIRGIYYLDSLTAPDTATARVAARTRINHWERDVFLDNSPDRVSIVRFITEGKKKADKGGPAVMIGHVWSAELAQTLADLYPQLVAEGFSLSTISKFMLDDADENSGD